MNSLTVAIKFFSIIMIELALLFLGISTLIGLVLAYISEDKLRRWLSRKGILGNIIGALIGGLTPFCACSTIPMTVGLLKAKVPFGAVMSFVVASPILNPVILTMMAALLGLKAAGIYAVVTFVAAILFGMILEKFGFYQHVKNVRVTGTPHADANAKTFKARLKTAFVSAWYDFRSVLAYLAVGVALGAAIYGYVPQDFVVNLAGPKNPMAIPIAALIGVPLYIRAETAIPIGLALIHKGMSVGAVIALIIGGAGMAIPEISMLASIFRGRLVGALVCVVFLTAVTAGLVFNLS
ncbi:MAG: permease [Desulfobacteraceae bacterium]|nr:MAG: permease [Desulfobacteraceae bacterium]